MPDSVGAPVRGRILIVDDEEDIRESLETLLSLEGYSVDLAVNATMGLERMAKASYDLVLLDLMMPDKSGMEVLAEVRERDQETPIFLITAYGAIDGAIKGMKAGAKA